MDLARLERATFRMRSRSSHASQTRSPAHRRKGYGRLTGRGPPLAMRLRALRSRGLYSRWRRLGAGDPDAVRQLVHRRKTIATSLNRDRLRLLLTIRILEDAEPGLTTRRHRGLLSGLDTPVGARLHDPRRDVQPGHRDLRFDSLPGPLRSSASRLAGLLPPGR